MSKVVTFIGKIKNRIYQKELDIILASTRDRKMHADNNIDDDRTVTFTG